jgi:hypothetical protein
VFRADLRIGQTAFSPHNGFAMRNFLALCLFLCPAGLIHATIVYSSSTAEASTTPVYHQTLDGTHDASSYALDVRILNLQYISGEAVPNTGLSDTPFGIEARAFETGSANLPLNQGTPASSRDTGTFGIAGVALLGAGLIRRPRKTQGQV